MSYEQKFNFRPIFANCSEEDVARLEQELGYTLPHDYRRFLEQFNGGVFDLPAGCQVAIPSDESEDPYTGMVQSFFGIPAISNEDSILDNRTSYNMDERIPAHLIPIGSNSVAEYYCLSLAKNDRGAVYLWCADEWTEEEGYDDIYRVANSFREFWDALHLQRGGNRTDQVPPHLTPKVDLSVYHFEEKLGIRPVMASCNVEDILRSEKWLNTQLPDDYRAFLLQVNGGVFQSREGDPHVVFRVGDVGMVGLNRLFSGRSRGNSEDIVHYHQSGFFLDRLPKNVVAIGETTQTQLILMSVGGERRGEIFLCRQPWDDFKTRGDPFELIPTGLKSFEEFWHSLRPLKN